MEGTLAPIRLPWDTLRPAARHFPPLALFYTLGLFAAAAVSGPGRPATRPSP